MTVVTPLVAVLALAAAAWLGTAMLGLDLLFGVVIPYGALAALLAGVAWRVLRWARVPVPFNISTTCGQQVSLPWVRSNPIENPHTRMGVAARMGLEVLLFRSLFRNVRQEFVGRGGVVPRLAYRSSLWLWAGALAFHYSFLIVLLHHFRFFSDPVPAPLALLDRLDGILQIGTPQVYVSGAILLGAALFLLARRLVLPPIRYISLATDYFPLFLVIGIALTGVLMRYTSWRVDIVGVKTLCLGLVHFRPEVPAAPIGTLFYVHLTLVSVLFACLPYSKLCHAAGVWLSPTRNQRAASRMIRHVNPWDYPVAVHTYDEYEDEYRGKMKAAGIPVTKE
ncbi:MAG: sulfate reduction electron transfer complex DsrMKJOP subunit DsrM [bacterium]|nr:sulfate reduction electron transfer complex DsrMKJOP subunit DsrM [bacterium]